MKQNSVEEQPNFQEVVTQEVVEPKNENIEQHCENTGSSKKFKSVEALSLAYDNLEKEFTKKCQRLSELENALSCDNKEQNSLPQYEKQDWNEKVKAFLNENALAKNFTKEISEELMKDDELSKKDDALNLAFLNVLKKNYKTEQDFINNGEFFEKYILNNEAIKTKIVEDYLNKISLNKTVPLITNVNGTNGVLAKAFRPRNLNEAAKMAENIFKD